MSGPEVFEKIVYLAFKPRPRGYGALYARLTERRPALASGEVAVEVTISLPAALFQRPQLRAEIVVTPDAVSPPVIDAAVADNIADVIREHTGLDMKIAVVPQETAE